MPDFVQNYRKRRTFKIKKSSNDFYLVLNKYIKLIYRNSSNAIPITKYDEYERVLYFSLNIQNMSIISPRCR